MEPIMSFLRYLTVSLLLLSLSSPLFAQSSNTQEKSPQEIVAEDARTHGFNWVPWTAAPQTVKGFVEKRDAHIMESILDQDNQKKTYVAVQDLDFDQKNDVIIWIYSSEFCGSHGCRFYVIPGDYRKRILAFNAERVKPIRRGIMADETPNYF